MNINNIIATVVSFVILVGGYWYGQRQYHSGYEKHKAEVAEQLAEVREELEVKEDEHVETIKEIDEVKYRELLDAQKTITQLRADVDSGNLRLRQARASNCATQISPTTSLGNEQRAESDAGGRSVEQDILTLAEYAKTAITQRDAAQEIIEADRLLVK